MTGPPGPDQASRLAPEESSSTTSTIATVLALTGTLVSLRSTGSRLPFLLTIAVAMVDVVLLLSSGASLLA